MPPENAQVDTGLGAEFDAQVDAALHPEPEKAAEEKPAEEKPADAKPAEDKPVQFKDEVRSTTWPEFEAAVLKAREVPVSTYVPPKPTLRQQTQTDLEMARGRERVAAAEAQKIIRVPGAAVPNAVEIKAQGATIRVAGSADFQQENNGNKVTS